MRWSGKAPQLSTRARALLVVAAMAVAVGINVGQLRAIDEDTPHNYRALYAYDTPDIYEIAITRDNTARRWVAPFHYFGRLYPDSTIVVPETGISTWFPLEEALVSLGRAKAIERLDYDAETLLDLADLAEYRTPASAFAPRSGRVQQILDERVGYFTPPDPTGTFIVVTPDGPPEREGFFALVDVSLIGEASGRDANSD